MCKRVFVISFLFAAFSWYIFPFLWFASARISGVDLLESGMGANERNTSESVTLHPDGKASYDVRSCRHER